MTEHQPGPDDTPPAGTLCGEPMLHGPCGRRARFYVRPMDANGQARTDLGGAVPRCGTHRLMHVRRAQKDQRTEQHRLAEQARREHAEQ